MPYNRSRPAITCILSTSASLVGLTFLGCGGGGSPSTPATPTAPAPTFAPGTGTYTVAPSVTIADSLAGTTIYYTVDGTSPTPSSTKYSAPFPITSTTTVAAIAVESGYNNSPAASATYTIVAPAAPAPTFSPSAGSYTSAQTITLADTQAGATIYYTVDGSTPTTSSAKYTAPFSLASTATVNAIAVASGYSTSAVALAAYTITLPATATPTFSPASGTFATPQTVSLADPTPNAAIFYTTDGSTPTAASTPYTAPFTVSATSTVKAIAVATGFGPSAIASATYTLPSSTTTVNVVLSTHNQVSLLAAQPPVTFGTNPATPNQVVVDETQTFQSIEGFGAAFTDSAAYLLETVEPASAQPATFSDLFTRNGNGIGLSFMRLPMGATDIARNEFTFDDLPSGTDPSLSNFSIKHDQAYVLPLVQAAKTLNPSMKIMANPWSPPAWMKDNNSVNGGTLLPGMYTPFANYFIKYIQAYGAGGVPIDYISLQNEPLFLPSNYPSMGMDAPTQTTVLRDFVLPALTTAGLSTRVLVYDHNWDAQTYPEQVFADPTILASPLVAGTAWHGYAGTPGAQQSVQNLFPSKGTWETEHSGGTFVQDQFSDDFLEITQVLRNSGKAYLKWSLALDENRGPNLSQVGLGGCNTCEGLVTVNSTTGAVTKTVEYYTLGHYSKYVLPGAKRVYSSNGIYTSSVAFLNPDGSKALIVYNNASSAQPVQVQWGTQSFAYTLPAAAAATFTWSGTQSGTSPLIATSEIQGSDFITLSGLQTENTGDVTGAYDLGYATPNAYASYNNVSFGTVSPTKVLVRTASGGNGGTLEFHLDSLSGTLLGTATMPVTGGYQTYQTVSAPLLAPVTGTHTLYIVFRGSGGIANVNWFQFQ